MLIAKIVFRPVPSERNNIYPTSYRFTLHLQDFPVKQIGALRPKRKLPAYGNLDKIFLTREHNSRATIYNRFVSSVLKDGTLAREDMLLTVYNEQFFHKTNKLRRSNL